MNKLLALVAYAATATSASAAPVYLLCVVNDSAPFDVALDEANSIATAPSFPKGDIQRTQAIFTADTVRFGSRATIYTIDRVTLRITREVPLVNITSTGKCQIQKVAKRAF